MKEKIEIDGVTYVKENLKLSDYRIIRTEKAGVFAGYLAEDRDFIVVLKNARRLWRWSGAASLSQLAVEGVNDPDDCKFAMPIPQIKLMGVIENIPATEKAKASIDEVKIWKV